MTNFNEQANTLLYKIMFLSHFILDFSVVRERWVETGTDSYIDPTFLLTIARCVIFKNPLSTSSASWLGCSTGGRWGPLPTVCKLALTLGFLSLTNSATAGTCQYSFITSTCFRFLFRLFTQVHLWLTARSRVNIQDTHTHSIRKYIHHHQQQHIMLITQISLTLSRHPSLSFIASGRSSRLHPVSVQSYCK